MNLSAMAGPKAKQVTLHWTPSIGADHYSLKYGLQSNNYIFGSTNIGNQSANTFVVDALKPGVRYFFRVGAVNGCTSFSNEASTITRKKGRVMGASRRLSRRYMVREGDTLTSIAARFGTSPMALQRMNSISSPDFITAGMMLNIP